MHGPFDPSILFFRLLILCQNKQFSVNHMNFFLFLCDLFFKCFIDHFLCCIFSYFWTYVCLHVIFLSLFSLFKINRFLLIISTVINTKLTCIITDFTIIILLIAKILLANININLTCFENAFTIYLTSAPNNDITRRVVMFP